MTQKVSFPSGKKSKKISRDLKGILKRFEGQKKCPRAMGWPPGCTPDLGDERSD
jgi:hypothetical protein